MTSALSLYPTKTLGAAGDGGAVLTDDPEVAALARAIGSHGMSAGLVRTGGNHRQVDRQTGFPGRFCTDMPQQAASRHQIRQFVAGHAQRLPVPTPGGMPLMLLVVEWDVADL